MSDHLPECDWNRKTRDLPACICDRLRAAEARVEESMDRAWTQAVKLAEAHARVSGYAAGVQAARDAVAEVAIRKLWPEEPITDALAAIDALRADHA